MKRLLLLLTVGFAAGVAAHADLMPNLANVPDGWSTDRYAPASFTNVGTYQGRSDVLGIGIDPAQVQSDPFLNTQGEGHAIAGGPGSSISADLYIQRGWDNAANGNVRTDMWGVIDDPSPGRDNPHQYPIIGFTNAGGARYRVWDEDTGWVDLLTPVVTGAWTSFSIEYTGSSYQFFINGIDVYSDNTVHGATGFSGVIMQAYNFGDGAYTADWSNTAPVPEPSSWLLLGTAALLVGRSVRKRIA